MIPAMKTATSTRILYALIWAFVIIASAFAFKNNANRDWIEMGLTGLALTFVVLSRESRCL